MLLFLEERQSDFLEMLMHHICAVSLLISMCYANAIPIGVTISFLHDIADITASFTKFWGLTPHGNVAATCLLTNMVVWGYTRMLVLPYMIYNIFQFLQTEATPTQAEFQVGFDKFKIVSCLSMIMLCAMCFLHYYWFTIFCQIIYV